MHARALPLLALALALPASAHADTLDATLGQPLREVAHAVQVRIDDGVAHYTVRRAFDNGGQRHEEASLRIGLPVGAAATGLRIKAGPQWFEGELMRAERAAALYEELTGIGPHAPRDPALLYWVWANEVHLQVFPVAPGGQSTVEYSLTGPTRYRDGRYVVSYPKPSPDNDLAETVLQVFPQQPNLTATIEGKPVGYGQPLQLGKATRPKWFGSRQPDPAASYTSSIIEVPEAGTVDQVKVDVDIRHTYRGDLEVALVAPSGRWHMLHQRAGGADNDVRNGFEVPLTKGPSSKRESTRGTWRLVVSDHARMDVGSVESWSLTLPLEGRKLTVKAKDVPKFVPDAPRNGNQERFAMITVAPPPIDTVASRLGRVVAAPKKQFLRLEVDAAPQLRPLPKSLSVVFVVDASHSMDETGLEAQLDVAGSFLRHVPDAHFDVVLFRRHATRLLGRFAPAGQFSKLVSAARKAGRLRLGNGSALDDGARVAVQAMRARQGPRTIVMLSDTLLRPSWKNQAALRQLASLPAVTIVHLVVPGVGDVDRTTDRRDDDHALAPIAAAHGGVLLHIDGVPANKPRTLDAVTLGLVRPIRIDDFHVEGAPAQWDYAHPARLEEGSGLREMVQLPAAPATVVLKGKIWAEPFRRVVAAKPSFSRITAAFVFSHDMHRELSREQMFQVAMYGRAVSPATSYLAIEPGVRPSTQGIDRLGSVGTIGYGAGTGSGRGFGHGRAIRPDLRSLVEPGLQRCLARHPPGSTWSASLRVETTYDEIVDVILDDPPSPLRSCIVEEIWRVRLTDAFNRKRDSFALALS